MTDRRFIAIVAAVLLAVSAGVYLLHLVLFLDPHHILIFLVGDIAFLPIEVLLVTLVIHELLESRARARRRDRLGMLISVFFSTVGIDLLAFLARADPAIEEVHRAVRSHGDWSPGDLAELRRILERHECRIAPDLVDLPGIKAFLRQHGDFLLRLLENPALLEHESLSELMRAIFHAGEELDRRGVLDGGPSADREHLVVDLERVYPLLVAEWLAYLDYVGRHYPYLFSLAVRTTPFDPDASVTID
jgi:hypothetical protein